MNGKTRKQLIEAANGNNGFAITLLAVYLINSGENVRSGVGLIMHAADAKNVLWAKNLKLYMTAFGDKIELPIDHQALIDSDTREQLENYIAEGDYWAMTILGELLYQGRVVPQDRETAEELLGKAANLGCRYASELVEEYGINSVKALASEVLRKFKAKNNPKYWIQK